MHRLGIAASVAILAAFLLAGARPALAQMDTADLTGRVLNPKGQAVAGARVRVLSQATGLAKETTTNRRGKYYFLALRPGTYQFTVLAKGFATLLNRSLNLTVGQRNIYNVSLETGKLEQTVTSQPQLINTLSSSNTAVITGEQISHLPINRRAFLNFTLLMSAVKRDDTPLAGAIPTSGFDFNGQRARGNEVTVDGADVTDAATGGVRTTVSQAAVQDFRVEKNNYMPEYGRAIGGTINILTKSGSNTMHGQVFGYLRNSRFQARDPFSVNVNPTNGLATAVKQPYTRVQAGASLGGAIQQNKFFYFLSLEGLRSHANGFSSIGQGNFGLSEQTVPCSSSPLLLTAGQASYFKTAIPAAGGCSSAKGQLLTQAESLYGTASNTAVYGNTATGPASFPLPVGCSSGGCTPANVVPLPSSYVGLSSLEGNYPTTDKTEFGSIRFDRIWNQDQRTFLMVSDTPSYASGIQVNSQGQTFGQNAGSRTMVQHFADITGVAQHTMLLSSTLLDEARFQFSRRGFGYNFSPLAAGANVAVNIPGAAFFGRDPLSTITGVEKRYELADNVTWVHGSHTIKFGLDVNFLQFNTGKHNKNQIFELNYGGVYNFAAVDPASVPSSALSQLEQQPGVALPLFSAVQAYGLGIPQTFTQGIGQSGRSFDDKMVGAFVQDSWQLSPRLTVNYGVRYDLALNPLFTPSTTIDQVNVNQQAESALNVVDGIPNDYKDVAPRLGLAWDPTGHGRTVVRAGFGLFYGVTPLAIIYDTAATDGTLSTQLEVGSGTATGVPVSSSTFQQAVNASSLFQGVLGGVPTIPATGTAVCGTSFPSDLGYLCSQQRFNPTLSGSLFSNLNYLGVGVAMPILPFSLPVAKHFVSMYSEQGNLTLEHQFGSNLKVSASYTFIRGLHLNRSIDVNPTNPVLLTQNFANAVAAGIPGAQEQGPLGVQVPLLSPGACQSASATSSFQIIAAGELAEGYSSPNCTGKPFGYIGTPSVFNFFRPSGPNPSYNGPNLTGYSQLVALAKTAGFPTGYGVPVLWGSVNEQASSGSSMYNGLTLTVSKQLSDHFQLLSSWTWSHALDNTTDFTTLVAPQSSSNPNEWANSAFDQRYRWVTSAIIESPYSGKQKTLLKRILENSFVAPIIDFASGRPYTVVTGTDYNLNFNSFTDRPSVVAPGTAGSVTSPYIPGVAFAAPSVCAAGIPASVMPYGCNGNLGRNTFVTPRFFNFDLRIDKKFYVNEALNFEVIAEGFNLLNRFNVLAVNPLCNPAAGGACSAGQPTAAFSPRQFQFGLIFNF